MVNTENGFGIAIAEGFKRLQLMHHIRYDSPRVQLAINLDRHQRHIVQLVGIVIDGPAETVNFFLWQTQPCRHRMSAVFIKIFCTSKNRIH